jgi:hypothetical protein
LSRSASLRGLSRGVRSSSIQEETPMRWYRALIAGALAISALPVVAYACSSCGCSLSSDWATQGYASEEGWRFDLRYEYFDQDDLRGGTSRVDRASLEIPNAREIQQGTVNRNYFLVADYSPNADWGINLQVPYFDRFHTTIAAGDTEISTSHGKGIGDVRLTGRYAGLTEQRDVGLQFGIKLATGAFHDQFIDGPQAGEPLDRGLQLGTGTTDLVLGIYTFGSIDPQWEYFAQAIVQQPQNSREGFKPGTGFNVNFGVRYVAFGNVVPQVQVNVRTEGREAGENADLENSGATLSYLSPGVSFTLGKNLQGYAFVQLPFYQRVNGLQIEPRYTASAGVHYAF